MVEETILDGKNGAGLVSVAPAKMLSSDARSVLVLVFPSRISPLIAAFSLSPSFAPLISFISSSFPEDDSETPSPLMSAGFDTGIDVNVIIGMGLMVGTWVGGV